MLKNLITKPQGLCFAEKITQRFFTDAVPSTKSVSFYFIFVFIIITLIIELYLYVLIENN